MRYITEASTRAKERGLHSPEQRLAAFQNEDVESQEGSFYDDYFGYIESLT